MDCPYGMKINGKCKKKPGPKKKTRSPPKKKTRSPPKKKTRSPPKKKTRSPPKKKTRSYWTISKCKYILGEKIAKNIEEYKEGKFSSRAQAIAVAYQQVSKMSSTCKKHFKR